MFTFIRLLLLAFLLLRIIAMLGDFTFTEITELISILDRRIENILRFNIPMADIL